MLETEIGWFGSIVSQMQKRVNARLFLFQVGGPLACELAKNPVVLQINDNLFAHGGILPHHGNASRRINHTITMRNTCSKP